MKNNSGETMIMQMTLNMLNNRNYSRIHKDDSPLVDSNCFKMRPKKNIVSFPLFNALLRTKISF